jgi:DNA-binding winged helix-turn-helix (wHTH) protein/predicted ATPase
MPDDTQWHFGPFRLEAETARLWRGPERLPLRPKSFAVLHYLLQHAGRLVSKDTLLQAVWPDVTVSEAMLPICLSELRRVLGETRQGPQFIETVARRGYRFIGAVRQVAPAGGRRAHLHRQIGVREEAGYGARAGERAAVLAMHFTRGRDAPRAVAYLRQAAENALERYAYREAITYLTQALAVLETLPASPEHTAHKVAVYLTLGPALIVTRGQVAPDVERTYARAWELCQRLEETPQLAPALHGLMSFYVNQGALERARALAEQQLRIAQRQPDPALRLVAHTSLGLNLYHAGDFVAARAHLEQGLAFVPQSPLQGTGLRHEVVDYGVLGLAHLARTLWKLGYPDQARQRSQEALRRAQQLAHPHSLGLVHRWTAVFEQLRGDGRAVREHAEAAVTLATSYEFPQMAALGTLMRGWALATQGQGPEGMDQMQQSLQTLQALGVRLGGPYWLALLAEIAGQQGQGATGRQWLAEALTTVHRTGERNHEAELYRLQGELLLSQEVSDKAGAAEALEQALAVARRQHAKSLELRAATSLARLWQQQGQHAAARALLAPIYGWFTEGFDTVDLHEARALLQELGAAPAAPDHTGGSSPT